MTLEPPDSPDDPENDVERTKRQNISRRIVERMDELGFTAKYVSQQAGLGDTYVSELIGDGTWPPRKLRSPGRDKLERIARVLQCSLEYLEGTIPTLYASDAPSRAEEPDQIVILGYIEPDTFRTMKASQQESLVVDIRRHPQYPHARHFALDVRGNDMNAARHRGRSAPIFDGTTVVCVDMVTGGIQVENGHVYAIERSLDGGHTVERLLRRAVVFHDRIDMIAESTERDRPTFSIPRDTQTTDQIKIIGLVYRWFYDYLR